MLSLPSSRSASCRAGWERRPQRIRTRHPRRLVEAELLTIRSMEEEGEEGAMSARMRTRAMDAATFDDVIQRLLEARDGRTPLRFLEIDSVAWAGLEETATAPEAKHHIGAGQDKGNVCLGLLNGAKINHGSTILVGVVYDNERRQIGWANSECTKPQSSSHPRNKVQIWEHHLLRCAQL